MYAAYNRGKYPVGTENAAAMSSQQKTYAGGNLQMLLECVQRERGNIGKVVYVGDHLHTDIMVAKLYPFEKIILNIFLTKMHSKVAYCCYS